MSGGNQVSVSDVQRLNANGDADLYSTVFLRRAHELNEEGNRRIQAKDHDLQFCPSPVALGASAVRGAAIAGLGPCLPCLVPKKVAAASVVGSNVSSNSQTKRLQHIIADENGSDLKTPLP
ncbi:hypothetical protein Nepgr_028712 [Nepenthes gracilis]|uniref:Uncharacterized protein n=1 Tax=Nepenthes gracilis TaxID=150966 RepID=A0AAD3TDF0_NEPGR|nr:hypothetical protein Nepgr_028712 [Nepenthes gracilis]